MKLEELKKELENIRTGEEILLLRKQMISAEIKEMVKMSEYELERAITIQTPEREKKILNNQIISLHLK